MAFPRPCPTCRLFATYERDVRGVQSADRNDWVSSAPDELIRRARCLVPIVNVRSLESFRRPVDAHAISLSHVRCRASCYGSLHRQASSSAARRLAIQRVVGAFGRGLPQAVAEPSGQCASLVASVNRCSAVSSPDSIGSPGPRRGPIAGAHRPFAASRIRARLACRLSPVRIPVAEACDVGSGALARHQGSTIGAGLDTRAERSRQPSDLDHFSVVQGGATHAAVGGATLD